MFGIDDLDRMINLDITGRDNTLALLAEGQCRLVVAMHANGNVLDVEQDFDDVLLQAFKGGVLVQHVVDLDLDHGAAGDRRQQNTTQRVAEGVAKTTLQWLNYDLRVVETDTLDLNAARTQHIGGSCHEQGLRKLR